MPMNRKLYPFDWEIISFEVREEAGWKCEFCGAENGKPHPVTGSRVVLTVAHLDHNPSNNDRSNLRALCQKCHLAYDQELHLKHRKERKEQKRNEENLQRQHG